MKRRSLSPVLSVLLSACATAPRSSSSEILATAEPQGSFLIYTGEGATYQTTFASASGASLTLPGLWVWQESGDRLAVVGRAEACGAVAACQPHLARTPTPGPDLVRAGAEACDDPAFESLVGGVLLGAMETHSDTCHTGLNMYGIDEIRVRLAAGAQPAAVPTGGYQWCVGHPEQVAAWDNDLVTLCRRSGDRWEPLDDSHPEACDRCDERQTPVDAAFLTNGAWVMTNDAWDVAVQDGLRQVAVNPLTPANCPSPEDPCGDPTPFANIPGVVVPRSEQPILPTSIRFWVASDGTGALVVRDDGWQVWRPGASSPAATVPPVPGRVLGVRFHRDVTSLLARACGTLADVQCASTFRATDTCTEEGTNEDECTYGAWDERDAKALGNSCFAHFKRGEHEVAHLECAIALVKVEDDSTRGAILYNLGLLAEARGEIKLARDYYDRSLAVRPNATVRKRLEGLQ